MGKKYTQHKISHSVIKIITVIFIQQSINLNILNNLECMFYLPKPSNPLIKYLVDPLELLNHNIILKP